MAFGLTEAILYGMIGKELLDRLPLPDFLMSSAARGQLELGRGQLDLQKRMFEASTEANKRTTLESRKRSDEMMAKMLGLRQQDRATEMYMRSKEGHDAMIMSLLAAMMQSQQAARQLPNPASALSMVGMLRR